MAQQLPHNGYVLGLDVGAKRIGVAIASAIAKLPQPLDMIPADDKAISAIIGVINREQVELVVSGLPRNMQGEETAQSREVRDFINNLSQQIDVPIIFADETLSSVRAESIPVENVSSDSLAACFILEEYFVSNPTDGNQ